MTEQEHHKKAFEYYHSLGEGRSHRKVASKFGVSLASVKLWGRTFGWKQKISERDAEVARAMATKVINEEAANLIRNKQIIQMAMVQLAKAIADGRIRMSLSDLDKLIRLELFLNEKPMPEIDPLYQEMISIKEKSDDEIMEETKSRLRLMGYQLIEKKPKRLTYNRDEDENGAFDDQEDVP